MIKEPVLPVFKAWQVIEHRLYEKAPRLLEKLPGGASEAAIAAFEKQLGCRLPQDMRESWLIHDGSGGAEIFDHKALYSLREIIEARAMWQDIMSSKALQNADEGVIASESVKPRWWNDLWLPFSDNGCGDQLCIDLDPAWSEARGQVIQMWHADDPRTAVNPSFQSWLKEHALWIQDEFHVLSDSGETIGEA